MNNKQHEELMQKLDILIKVNTAILAEGKEFKEQVQLLNDLGLGPKEISGVTGKTANNISVTLNRLKKDQKSNNK